MAKREVKVTTVLQNLIPNFVGQDYPLLYEFLKSYYTSLSKTDIISNIDHYIKFDTISSAVHETACTSEVSFFDDIIFVESTEGFSNTYGIIQIDSEIILYEYKTDTTFENCVRGFSGITSYDNTYDNDNIVFEDSNTSDHVNGSIVKNLDTEFLKTFFKRLKYQYASGFDSDSQLNENLNQSIFIQNIRDFYSSKGTDESFRILFQALYNKDAEIIKPIDYVFRASDSQYRITKDLVVESIIGDPTQLINKTIFQTKSNGYLAKGTVTNVEQIYRNSKIYYQVSLDYDFDKDIDVRGTVFGEFEVSPFTTILNKGDTYLDVDSTLSFPDSGSLICDDQTISYTEKNLTQFLNCVGIPNEIINLVVRSSISYGYGYNDDNEEIQFRITGVLSNLNIPDNTFYFEKGDSIQVKCLGEYSNDIRLNNWLFNIVNTYKVSSLIKKTNAIYELFLYDNHIFTTGDTGEIIDSSGIVYEIQVIEVISNKIVTVRLINSQNLELPTNSAAFYIKRNISKFNSKNFTEANVYSTNVQNTYLDKEDVYVSTSSLPTYSKIIEVESPEIYFDGSYSNIKVKTEKDNLSDYQNYLDSCQTITTKVDHGLLTGSEVTISISDFVGIYFAYVVASNQLKLAKSKEALFNVINSQTTSQKATYSNIAFIKFSNDYTNEYVVSTKFVDDSFNIKPLKSANLVAKLSTPKPVINRIETPIGATGILANGVEIQNYKSDLNIFYGSLERIYVNDSESDYDVINPPSMSITDSIGIGASANVCVKGGLNKILVADPGFDYIDPPIVKITGGNGKNCDFSVNLRKITHLEKFDSTIALQSSGNLNQGVVGFSTYHKFRPIEKVLYRTNNQKALAGLSTNAEYYISSINDLSIKIFKNLVDCQNNTNSISITNYGEGIHSFEAIEKKTIIDSINVLNSGENYTNQKTTINSNFIDVDLNTFNYENHQYETDEVVVYTPQTISIAGLSSALYKIQKIDDNSFKLKNYSNDTEVSLIGVSTNTYHSINYQPISIDISYKSYTTFNRYVPKLIPIFTGKIHKVNLITGGQNYGSPEIVNHNRQPIFTLASGSGAVLYPIIDAGEIVEVIVSTQGGNYESIPDLIIEGPGYGAILTPIIQNKKLVKVNIINSGIGYEQNKTKISVKSRGTRSNFEASIQKWTVNLFEYSLDKKKISQDDGILLEKSNILQYSHLYCPRELRSTLFASKINQNGEIQYQYDINNDTDTNLSYHSPIIGWAYDGNPIYGPYGYIKDSNNARIIGQLKSGYNLKLKDNRPSGYRLGYFIEDYVYTSIKDGSDSYLDENNGRFCVTPEFPDGTYAYFTTIDLEFSTNSIFFNEKLPVFPYLIGKYYNSEYIDQNNHDILSINPLRNTKPYGILNTYTETNHFISPNKYIPQLSSVISSKSGKIDQISIVNPGSGYKINDSVEFIASDETKTFYSVSAITGKEIDSIVGYSSIIDNVEVRSTSNLNTYEFYCKEPHLFNNNDVISVSQEKVFKNNQHTITVNINNLVLNNVIDTAAVTGIVTYISVFGNLDVVRSNDIYSIKNEKVKILNVDKENSRLRVIRNYDSTIGAAYSTNTLITENPKRFYINDQLVNNNTYQLNDFIYFNPKESLGLGRTFGVGITTTLKFSNPGVGQTVLDIPTRTIYIPNHSIDNFVEAKYLTNGYTGISVSNNGVNDYVLTNNSTVYLTKVTNDLVGLSTFKVGLSSSGDYVGLGTTGSLLYLINAGSGDYHTFLTVKNNVLTVDVSKKYARVTTKTNHNLNVLDKVNVNVISGLTTEYTIKFNAKNKRLVSNIITFSSVGVNTSDNTIQIQNHKFKSGDKVIYNSSTPSVGLSDDKIYYIKKIDSNNVGLTSNYLGEGLINIDSQSSGSLSVINSELFVYKNSVLSFNVSDSSLASFNLPAFDLKFYIDSEFKNEYEDSLLKVQRINIIGLSSESKVKLIVDENTPSVLYYNLVPINLDFISEEQKNIIVDRENISNSNKINFIDSAYSGKYSIVNKTSTTFDYNLIKIPELLSYSSSTSDLTYNTSSSTANGGIYNLNLNSIKNSYKTLSGIGTIITQSGTGAIIYPASTEIGKIKKVEIEDIGFEYSSDLTLRPTASLPQMFKIEPMSSIGKISIITYGIGYSIYPDLILIDGFTNKIVSDINLKIESDNNVKILNNTKGIYNVPPRLIPINNSNGVGINSISYNSGTKDVTITLNASYSTLDTFPFAVGDNILIENVQITETDSNYKNYNSSEFNYNLFKITQINPNLGGSSPTIIYNYTANFGTYNNQISIGRVIPEKHFPQFKIDLFKNIFFEGEIVEDSYNNTGYVIKYDDFNQYLKVLTNNEFKESNLISGRSSKSVGLIKQISEFKSTYDISASSIVNKGWNIDYISLNNSLQRIHDNDYYQYFSYSIKSNVSISTWNNSVSNLNHPAGFKKFSNLIIESRDDTYSGISTDQPSAVVAPIKFIINRLDLNCVNDFDLVNENYYYTPELVSNEVVLNSQILQDYSESVGNRVLNIDDISGEFSSKQNLNVVNSFRI
jgi:hypothetical protein